MTGSDISYFLSDLLNDLLNLGSADLFSIAFRLVVVLMGLVVVAVLVKFLARIFWDVFGGIFKGFWWVLSTPHRLPQEWIRQAKAKKQRKQWKEQDQIQAEKAQFEREHYAREAEEKRIEEEEKALDIINTPPDLSRFKK